MKKSYKRQLKQNSALKKIIKRKDKIDCTPDGRAMIIYSIAELI